ncbi:hypothetical protein CFAM422_003352 [Trichoderma lentiforme]|uniref:Uncharacterized protein n=1 Tax=Trichoderma lentiforme TaxID=1567552 RepID=A0A9P4XLJ6_9HYPO|nr:hypothetical protein CFAM422_003352 [Trichoderma lentiforme]
MATAIPDITSDFHNLNDIDWYGGTVFIIIIITSPLNRKLCKGFFLGRYVYLDCIFLSLHVIWSAVLWLPLMRTALPSLSGAPFDWDGFFTSRVN